MSEELIVLKEYVDSLRMAPENTTRDSLSTLKHELLDAGEFGLAHLVAQLNKPEELWDYIGEEE